MLEGGVEANHLLINVRAGATAKFSGQSLEVGPTVLAPTSAVQLSGQTTMNGSLISGGLSRRVPPLQLHGSKMEGNATLGVGSSFGGE